MVSMPRNLTPKRPATLKPRRCKYCRATFVPERAQDKDAKFCEPNHRKAYWRFGGLPFDKMKEQIMKEVRKLVRAEFEAMRSEPHTDHADADSTPLRQVVREEIERYKLTRIEQ